MDGKRLSMKNNSLPLEIEKSCKALLKKIYKAFPGEDAPDLLSDIERLAQKAYNAGTAANNPDVEQIETKKTAVYECEHYEFDNDDPSGCGESWSWCHNEKSGRRECNCVRIYAQQFCPFYKKGMLRGKWVIDETDKAAAEKFKESF